MSKAETDHWKFTIDARIPLRTDPREFAGKMAKCLHEGGIEVISVTGEAVPDE